MRIEPAASTKLNGGRLVPLRVLVNELGLSPKTVYGWARRGTHRHRLPTINLAGRRYTTIQAFNQFVADQNGWSRPCETGDQLGVCLGRLSFAETKITH